MKKMMLASNKRLYCSSHIQNIKFSFSCNRIMNLFIDIYQYYLTKRITYNEIFREFERWSFSNVILLKQKTPDSSLKINYYKLSVYSGQVVLPQYICSKAEFLSENLGLIVDDSIL